MFNTNIVTHNMSCALNLGLVTNAKEKKNKLGKCHRGLKHTPTSVGKCVPAFPNEFSTWGIEFL